MKAFAIMVVIALGSLALGSLSAAARECPVGCGRQTRACVEAARVDVLGCKQACRTGPGSGGAGACLRSCTTAFTSAKSTCKRDRLRCFGMCPPASPPGSCDGDACGRGLATCAEGVIRQARVCLGGCAAATDRRVCLQGCAAAAEAGAAACANAFAACVGPCWPPTTTTTVPPATCGPDPAGSCSGLCPSGATCEPFRSGSGCACVAGLGEACGGNLLAPPVACGPGLVCRHSNPDATGICVEQPSCIPFFQSGCAQTSDCCEPCADGRIAPCAVCVQGECLGAP